MNAERPGHLVCVGLGITLGSQLSELARNQLQQADVVFFHANSHYLRDFLSRLNPNLVDMQSYYQRGDSRLDSYEAMVEVVMQAVQQGKQVCWACYGHPGIASWPPHQAIRRLRALGFGAEMQPGISADACLWADLGEDPMERGCLQLEASRFLFQQPQIDISAWLVLWQPGIAGDHTLKRLESDRHSLAALVQKLGRWYPLEHQVILYEAAELPIWRPRIDRLPLSALPEARLEQITTLVIPPASGKQADTAMLDQLGVPGDHPLRRV
tara:strand:+ start:88763 stop:89569 length:807 start_codon:yes stop_codon:yes gene_type:complete